MADVEVDLAKLPQGINEQLRELELELSEGKSLRVNFHCQNSVPKY